MSIFVWLLSLLRVQSCSEPVIIVGGGMAGLAAASQALETGAEQVIIVDKETRVGGNSAKATSGINGPTSGIQKEAGIDDSVDQFAYDTMVSGNMGDATGIELGTPSPLVETLSKNAAGAIDFLKSCGADLTNLVQLGGHSAKRTHRPQGGRPAGWTFVSAVKKSLEGRVEYRLETRMTGIIVEDGRAVGIRYEDAGGAGELRGAALILATGGYANDHTEDSLLKQHRPDLISVPTTNGKWATGDGVKLGTQIGAGTVDMEAVQVHPTGFVDPNNREGFTKFLAPEAIRGSGALLLNAQGRRFVNELTLRELIVREERKQKGPLRLLLNKEAKEKFGPGMNFYIKKGFGVEFDSLGAAAAHMGVDAGVLRATIEQYRDGVAKGEDVFGKTVFPTEFAADEAYFVLAEIVPVIHYTMGGLKINERAMILNESDEVIEGLFGAGEVTGGVHGKNRLAANSLLECVVFGRVAGEEAVNYACPHTKTEL